MEVVSTIPALQKIRTSQDGCFGLVPTMGALHDGHLSLVERAKAECDITGVSIFINPTQFGPNEDLNKYPRDIENDLNKLRSYGVDIVLIPGENEMYPDGFQTWVTVERVTQPLEGKSRPGHFRGVATIVLKLFNIFHPDRIYFGQKDAQQVAVIRRMKQDLNLPGEIVVCPIVREPDGLAKSSRNIYLDPQERQAATILFKALSEANILYEKGERNGDTLRETMSNSIASQPLAREVYVSVADPMSLIELDTIDTDVLLSLAVYINKVRLIDNILITH